MALLVNGEYVDDEVIRQEAAAMRPRYEEMTEEMDPIAREVQLREWSRENVIERVLLRQEAAKDTAPIPREMIDERLTALFPPAGDLEGCEPGATRAGVDHEAARHEIETQFRMERLIEKIAATAGKPKNKDLTAFYKENRERFWTAPAVRASHIVRNVNENATEETALGEIKKAEQELQAGVPFAEVADRYSDCPGQGGALGWFPLGEMVEEFDKVVFALETNTVSGIFRTEFGWHIAIVHESRPEGIRPFNDVKDLIEGELSRMKREKALEDFVDRLRAKATVQNTKRRESQPAAMAEAEGE